MDGRKIMRMEKTMETGMSMVWEAASEARTAYQTVRAVMDVMMTVPMEPMLGSGTKRHLAAYLEHRNNLLKLESILMRHSECSEGFEPASYKAIDAYVLALSYAHAAYRAKKKEGDGEGGEEEEEEEE
jgi:hypothetical protein